MRDVGVKRGIAEPDLKYGTALSPEQLAAVDPSFFRRLFFFLQFVFFVFHAKCYISLEVFGDSTHCVAWFGITIVL